MTTSFDRRRTPAREDLAAAHLEGAIAAPRYVEGRRMRVVDEAIPLRAEPSPDCSLDTQLLFGEEVVVYDSEEGWAWGQAQNDFAMSATCRPIRLPRRQARQRIKSSAPRTFLYPAANMKMPNLGALPMGAQVEARATRGDFVQLPNGLFVYAAHLVEMRRYSRILSPSLKCFLARPISGAGKTFSGSIAGARADLLASRGVARRAIPTCNRRNLAKPLRRCAVARLAISTFWKGHVGIMQDAQRMLHASGHHMQVVVGRFRAGATAHRGKSLGESSPSGA